MKELGMSWSDIKKAPRHELEGLLHANNIYGRLHAYDGYSSKDINEYAKNNPSIRGDYSKYLELNEEYKERAGVKRRIQTFNEIIK
jgi:hypothetical protein